MFKHPRPLPRTSSVITANILRHLREPPRSLPPTSYVIAKNTLGHCQKHPRSLREGGNLLTPPENPTNHTNSVIPIYAQRQILI